MSNLSNGHVKSLRTCQIRVVAKIQNYENICLSLTCEHSFECGRKCQNGPYIQFVSA